MIEEPHIKIQLTRKMSVNLYSNGSVLICQDNTKPYTDMVYLSAKAARRLRKALPHNTKPHSYQDEQS